MAEPVAIEEDARATSCLLSLQDPEPLFSPLGSSTRIKYTCIAASPNYIALGANTGGVYCFHRDGPRYIRLLANKEGSLSHVRFSPDESCLAVVIGGCQVVFWELNFREKGESKRFHVSSLFKDSTVRDLVWDSKGTRLFYGDDQGRVGVAYMPKHLKKFSSSSLFRRPDEVIYHDRSPIVQLDFLQEMLLVSTQARGVLIKLSSREVVQVGQKARDGPFGACFHRRWSGQPPVVYSARPGSRLWEANIVEGKVQTTLLLRKLVSIPATPILGRGFSPEFSTGPPQLTQALIFTRLQILSNRYIIGWQENSLFLFDSMSYKLAAWNRDMPGIVDVCSDDSQLLVLYEGGRKVVGLRFWSLGECLQELVKYGELQQAEMLLRTHSSEVAAMLPGNRALYLPVKTTMDFSRSNSDDLTDGLESVQSALTVLEESIELDSLETDPGSAPYRQNGEEDSTELPELESSEEIESLQSVGRSDDSGTALKVSEEQKVAKVDSTSQSDVISADLYAVALDTDLPLLGETKATENQLTGVPQSKDVAGQGLHGNMPNSVANEEGYYPTDDPNLDMPLGFEEVDLAQSYDYSVEFDEHRSDSAQLDTGPRGAGSALESKSETELTANLPPKRSHYKSNSWGGDIQTSTQNSESAEPNDQPPREAQISAPQPPLGEPDHSSTRESLLPAYPESTGIEIPCRENLPGGPEISDQDDPFALQNSTSGPSSLETTSSQGAEMEISLPPKQPETATELLPNFLRSNSLSAVKSEVTSRLSSALKRKSNEGDVIAVPIKGSGSKEGGGSGKSKGKRKGLKRKKVSSPALVARRMSNPDTAIPEEEMLPFPEVVVPPTTFTATHPSPFSHAPLSLPHSPSHSHFSSAATSRSISPQASLASTPPKELAALMDVSPAALLSKVESITTEQSPSEKTEQVEDSLKTEFFGKSATIQGLASEELEKAGEPSAALTLQGVEKALQVSISEKPETMTPSLPAQADTRYVYEADTVERSESSERNEKTSPGSLGRKSAALGRKNSLESEVERATSAGVQRSSGSSFFSKMKSIAKQGGQNIGLESGKRRVKGLFSSLTSPNPHSSLTPIPPAQRSSLTPSSQSGGYFDSQLVFRNEDCVKPTPQTGITGSIHTSPTEYMVSAPVSEATPTPSHDPETTAFATATMDSMRQLEDPAVISPDKIKHQLRQWLHELDKFRRHAQSGTESKQLDFGMGMEQNESEMEQGQLSNSSSDVFQNSLYQSLEDSVTVAVTEMMTLCVELEVFGSSEGPDSLPALLASCLSVVDGWRVRVAVGEREWEERGRLWALMGLREIEGDYAVTLIADDVDLAVDYITDHQSELATNIPAYMIRLFEARPQALVDLCVTCHPYIMPWEVAMACGLDQSDTSTESCDIQATSSVGEATYARYLSRVMAQEEDRGYQVAESLRNSPQLLLVSMETLLKQDSSREQLFTESGSPRPFSHMMEVEHRASLAVLVDVAVTMETLHREACRGLCEKYGYWLGVIQLAVSAGNTRLALHTLLSLRDMRLFTETQKWGQVLNTVEDWRLLLQLMSEMKIIPCREAQAGLDELPRGLVPANQSQVTVATATEFQPRNAELQGTSKSQRLTGFHSPGSSRTNTGPIAGGTEESESEGVGQYFQDSRAKEIATMEESSKEIRTLPQQIHSPSLGSHRTHSPTLCEDRPMREGREAGKFELTWLAVFRLMLSSLGPRMVWGMLAEVEATAQLQGGALPQQLHSLLVRLTAVHTQQRRVAHTLLEKMNHYLWTQRSTALSPQLQALQQRERQSQQTPSPGTVTTVPSFSPCLEDAAAHWGVKIGGNTLSPGGTCAVCKVSVLRTVSDRLPGVIAFQCGHAYHRQCLSEQACMVCFTANLQEHHDRRTRL